jgi:hypothetical protein
MTTSSVQWQSECHAEGTRCGALRTAIAKFTILPQNTPTVNIALGGDDRWTDRPLTAANARQWQLGGQVMVRRGQSSAARIVAGTHELLPRMGETSSG